MSALEIIWSAAGLILKLAAVIFLAAYLLSKHRQRMQRRTSTEDPARWTGQTLDATKLRPAVDRVRHDYLAHQPARFHSLSYRRSVLALAGQAIRKLPFFRDQPGHTAEPEDAPSLRRA